VIYRPLREQLQTEHRGQLRLKLEAARRGRAAGFTAF
jgi:hypothetical protein